MHSTMIHVHVVRVSTRPFSLHSSMVSVDKVHAQSLVRPIATEVFSMGEDAIGAHGTMASLERMSDFSRLFGISTAGTASASYAPTQLIEPGREAGSKRQQQNNVRTLAEADKQTGRRLWLMAAFLDAERHGVGLRVSYAGQRGGRMINKPGFDGRPLV